MVKELVFKTKIWEDPHKKSWTHFFGNYQNPKARLNHEKKLELWKFPPLMKENVCNIQKMTTRHEEMLDPEVEIHVGVVDAPSFPPSFIVLFSLLVSVPIVDCNFLCLVELGLLPLETLTNSSINCCAALRYSWSKLTKLHTEHERICLPVKRKCPPRMRKCMLNELVYTTNVWEDAKKSGTHSC